MELADNPKARATLGEQGWALASSRLSDHLTSCLGCDQPLATAPVTITATPIIDHTLVLAHHLACTPRDAFQATHVLSGLLLGGLPFILVHPSAEARWLRRADGEWIDDTIGAFLELGFRPGRPDVPLQPVPNATIQISGDQVTVDIPPVHRWSAPLLQPVVAAIRAHGQAGIFVSTATDHYELDQAKLAAMFSAEDYVGGLVDHAPVGHSRFRTDNGFLTHPAFAIHSPRVNARTLYLHSPEIEWSPAVLVDPDSETADASAAITNGVPVALLETPSAIANPDEPGDHFVEAMIRLGLARLTSPPQVPTAPGWALHQAPGHLELRAPDGTGIAAHHTPSDAWLAAAREHGATVVLYGPVLGVRDSEPEGTRTFDAAERRAELTAAVRKGLVAAGLVTFHSTAA